MNCTPLKCNAVTDHGGICSECLRRVAEMELALWGTAPLPGPLGIAYWIKKADGLGGVEERQAEQFDEPVIIHTPK